MKEWDNAPGLLFKDLLSGIVSNIDGGDYLHVTGELLVTHDKSGYKYFIATDDPKAGSKSSLIG